MNLVLANGFCELTEEEALFIDGGFWKKILNVGVLTIVCGVGLLLTAATAGLAAPAAAAICVLGGAYVAGGYGLVTTALQNIDVE